MADFVSSKSGNHLGYGVDRLDMEHGENKLNYDIYHVRKCANVCTYV